MSKTSYLMLFVISLIVLELVAWFQTSPGYMDADFYFAGGIRLVEGHGFSEQILWNYLDDAQSLPHPSHGYWMPLASILAAIPMLVLGRQDFFSARLIFILMDACISPLCAFLSMRVFKKREYAFMSGILAIFPGFYLPYMMTTDTFGICMLLGIGWFGINNHILGVASGQTNSGEKKFPYLLLGIISGSFNLTRAEGIIWLLFSLCGIVYIEMVAKKIKPHWGNIGNKLLLCTTGYLMVFGPWLIRNLSVYGSFFAPGGIKTLWLTSYEELFTYPASKLNFMHWWSSGLGIAKSRAWAFWQNMQTTLAVQGQIILLPLILWGIYKLRKDYQIKIVLVIWFVLLFIMTIIFPYQGARGGFFHTGAALQPFFWVLVPIGFNEFILWGKRVRNWKIYQSNLFFTVSLICLIVMVSLFVLKNRVIGDCIRNPIWGRSNNIYQQVDQYLKSLSYHNDDIIMVNNPPGFYVASGHPSIVIPNEDESTLLEVSRRYGARYLLVESNHPARISGLFFKHQNRPGLQYVEDIQDVVIYEITER